VKDQADLPGSQKVLAAITVQGLARYQGKPAPKPLTYTYETPRLEPKVASGQLRFVDPRQFWSIFAAAMNENPPPKSQLEALLPNFRYLGIERGKPWDPNKVDPLVLEQMKVAAAEIGPMMNRIAPVVGSSGALRDQIVVCYHIPAYGQCLETIKLTISYRVFQGSKWTPTPDQYERKQTGKRRKGSRTNTRRLRGQSGV
jgi:hypothetical protein